MQSRLSKLLKGDAVKFRAARGFALTLFGFGGRNLLRLISNLILTRLLFPEAFGLMALVQIFITGLGMFSDLGINASIIQNKRGDDPVFVNTAWTLQICRGVLLWIMACAIAFPASQIYGEELLAYFLPIAGLNALISGFDSMNVARARRHLRLGRLTMIELSAQFIGLIGLITLAYITRSVWALVIGGLISSIVKLIFTHTLLPGPRSVWHWDKQAFLEIFGFGKFIFLSTIASFMIAQSDRAILGAHITLTELGIFSVGFLLGSLPFVLCKAISTKVIFPLYRMRPPARHPSNRKKVFQARWLITASMLLVSAVFAHTGIFLVDSLYDDRYANAGPILVLISATYVPLIVLQTYPGVNSANGNSYRFFQLVASTALVQVTLLLVSVESYGIIAAIAAPPLAALTTYPLLVYFAADYKAWDWKHDAVLMPLGLIFNGTAVWLNWERIAPLFG